MKKFELKVIAGGEVIKTCIREGAEETARWIGYAKRNAGFATTQKGRENWKSQLDLMEVGDSMGYAMPGASGGVEDFARVERVA